jgi:photosystem II stability/assembly factor-like uncharacterized protein/tRNA A-37 threonylcarbamoyl transferase component Bud32
MPQIFTCPQGHQWPAADEKHSFATLQAIVCPICKSKGAAVPDSIHPGDDSKVPVDAGTVDYKAPANAREDDLRPTTAPLETGELRPTRLAASEAEAPPPRRPAGPSLPTFAGYELLSELGRGGMGVVYKARQKSLNRIVALKMILAGAHAHQSEAARFRIEAEAVARLQHPNIVQIYEIAEQDGRLYCALEFLEGGRLDKRLRRRPLSPQQAAQVMEVLARAMHHAHQRGIIHRDLKPSNVLLTSEGIPKITDFGLARRLDTPGHTQTGDVLGTPSYMSPEQALGNLKAIGPATDIYSLGSILYELLTGKPPFAGPSVMSTLQKVLEELPIPPINLQPGIPRDLQAICLKCLQKEPAQRYATAAALADDLRRFHTQQAAPAAASAASAAPAPIREEPHEHQPSGGLAGVVVALALTVAAGGIGYFFWKHQQQQPQGVEAPRWESLLVPSGQEVFQRIAFPTRTVGFAASRQGLYKTEDGGHTWRRIRERPDFRHVYFLHFTDAQNGWYGTDQIWQTTDGGTTWEAAPLPEPMQAVNAAARSTDGWMLAGGSNRATPADLILLRKPNAAAPWEKLDPAKSGYWGADQAFRHWFLSDVTIVGPQEALVTLYKGSEDGGALLRTSDGGATWKTIFQSDHDLYRVRLVDGKQGWLTGSRGSIWLTEDGGTNWTLQPNSDEISPICLEFAPGGSSFGVAPLGDGKVLLFADKKWQTVTALDLGYSLPSAAVVDPGCVYVLSADGRIAHYIDPNVTPQ